MSDWKTLNTRLRDHAAGTPDISSDGLADSLWRYRNDRVKPDLRRVCHEIVGLIAEAGMSRGEWSPGWVPSDLAYSVAEISAQLLQLAIDSPDRAVQLDAGLSGWHIASAWEALLAGDIDDVVRHVAMESSTRGLRDWQG
jgi:AcrR family transcriptional regulator